MPILDTVHTCTNVGIIIRVVKLPLNTKVHIHVFMRGVTSLNNKGVHETTCI